jgi:hypothetical protein
VPTNEPGVHTDSLAKGHLGDLGGEDPRRTAPGWQPSVPTAATGTHADALAKGYFGDDKGE